MSELVEEQRQNHNRPEYNFKLVIPEDFIKEMFHQRVYIRRRDNENCRTIKVEKDEMNFYNCGGR